jgi:Subtilisin-like serine proteases
LAVAVPLAAAWAAAARRPGPERRAGGIRLVSGSLPRVSAGPEAPLRVVVARPRAAPWVARRIRERGGRIVAVLPGGAFLVAGSAAVCSGLNQVAAQLAWPGDVAVGPALRRRALGAERGAFTVIVRLAGGDTGAPERLAIPGVALRWSRRGEGVEELGLMVDAAAGPALLEALDALPGLVVADLQPPLRLFNAASAWRCQSGIPDVTPVYDHGIHGEGQVIGIMDTGLDIDSCFFRDDEHGLPVIDDDVATSVSPDQRKVLAVDFYWDQDYPDPGPADWDSLGHGTHVAGSAAGDSGADGVREGEDGMAPAARLVIQDGGYLADACSDLPGLGCPVRPLEPVFEQSYLQGARIFSNSWGDEEEIQPFNRYTERTADVDRFVWDHQDALVVFAAGNSGPTQDTVGSPATGKNVVAVGATEHGDFDPPCVISFSSRGWTQDGRIKPDVVAPGTGVMSALSDRDIRTDNCNTARLSGTSMACPTVAGLAALVRQYFTAGFYPSGVATPGDGFEPSAALLKAVLIASAVDLNALGCSGVAPVPSRDQGWGIVQLDRALAFAGGANRLLVRDERNGFPSAASPPVGATFRVTSPGPLKVVLVWTDPPSTSLAPVNLVNDLDLVVSGPDGVFLGNVFAAGSSVPGGAPDRLNNVEVVYLPAASTGTWTWTVAPHAVSLGPQGFAVVVTGPVAPLTPRRARGRVPAAASSAP